MSEEEFFGSIAQPAMAIGGVGNGSAGNAGAGNGGAGNGGAGNGSSQQNGSHPTSSGCSKTAAPVSASADGDEGDGAQSGINVSNGMSVGALLAAAASVGVPQRLASAATDKFSWFSEERALRAARASEMASGAVGELYVHVLRVTGLMLEPHLSELLMRVPMVASSLFVGLAVGEDGTESIGSAISTSGASAGGQSGEVTLPIEQHFRLGIHDLLTQRLRLRVLIKEIAQELAELGSAELSLADLRVGSPAQHVVALPGPARRSSALVHLQLTFKRFPAQEDS